MGFWGALFGGKNDDLNKDIDQSAGISSDASKLGAQDVNAASGFYTDILSGDPTKEGEALAPEISGLKSRVGQQKKTGAEFGTRSGGTAAQNNAADTNANTEILNLEGGLKQSAASGAASLGTSQEGLGLEANQVNAKESQQRMENWLNSILGKGITEAASTAESIGLGKIPT